MKKCTVLLTFLCLLCSILSGCSKDAAAETQGLEAVEEQGLAAAGTQGLAGAQIQGLTATDAAKVTALSDSAAVDLTKLSSTLVYAEVYNMLTSPEKYMGRTVKMSGPYYTAFLEETNSYYHYVIIEDAAACCQSGLEFIWNGSHVYPADYPADNTNIEVEGVFNSYDELGQTYYYLAVDEICVLEY